MKIIDLLNKIANGEKTKSINYKGESSLTYYLYDKCGSECDDTNLVNILNDEIEIIEDELRDIEVCGSLFTRSEYNRLAGIKEDKKIEKLEHMNSRDYLENRDEYLSTKGIALDIETLRHWINKIIDYINKEK